MEIDPHSHVPLHAQVEQAVLQSMADGGLPAGARLPPEDQLIERFGVSRTTIRTAIQSLLARGLVEIRRGKGTFVTQPAITQELTELTGFVEDMRAIGREPSALVLDRRVVAASETVARQLSMQRGAAVARIQRVRLADGSPLSFDETYLPLELGEKIMAEDLENQPIFSLLEQKFATPLLEAEYRLAAVASHGTVARALGVDAGSPIFLIERTTFSSNRRPVDYERLYYRGDHIRFVTRLTRRQPSSPRTAG
ncbi:MAG TPA: GntR family transcriptional regulator [Steroidobacteraceae bacterium]|jgi:GntR family transcriptional regulator|nr:GntR family transcriptional regulator [Steroidobacteraceae bacterium]